MLLFLPPVTRFRYPSSIFILPFSSPFHIFLPREWERDPDPIYDRDDPPTVSIEINSSGRTTEKLERKKVGERRALSTRRDTYTHMYIYIKARCAPSILDPLDRVQSNKFHAIQRTQRKSYRPKIQVARWTGLVMEIRRGSFSSSSVPI